MNDNQSKVLIGVAAFIGGAGLGFFLGRRQQKIVDAVPKQSWGIDDIRAEQAKQPETVDVGEAFIHEKLKEKELEDVIVDNEDEAVRTNIFPAVVDDNWDYEVEKANRTELAPYILHKDEFFAEEYEYRQTTLTYYEGDDILADEDDVPIYNFTNIVGPLQFGHGSGDPNVFYIRNDRLKGEYEILRHTGLFSVEVQGLEIEDNQRTKDLKHSAEPRHFKKD